MPKGSTLNDKRIVEGKVFAILAYLSILCIIPLLFQKENDFVLRHSKQGLVIFVGQVGVFILSILPLFGWFLKFGMFVLLLLSFIGIIAVLKGKHIELPVISRIADQITL
ncbi:MAG: hypothetical protein KAJ18_01605 [Candidatus Omnitrophica bacterium]|nr:hypothetical protein [Candidatus Omnitrophota bacterium]